VRFRINEAGQPRRPITDDDLIDDTGRACIEVDDRIAGVGWVARYRWRKERR
jgi:hypothetical protein